MSLQAVGLAWAEEPAATGTAPAAQLPAVTVRADAQETATSPVFGFVAKRSATATKTDTPVMETPQSVTVITRDRIEAQGAQTVQQAMGYTAGVHAGLYGNDNRGDWGRFRGADFTQYQDGLLNQVGFYNNVRPDVYALERIDILRGPSSMLFGQGAVGGILNLVSKRPQAEAAREIGVQFGNHDRKQVQADLTGPLDEDGKWLYRLVALARDSGTQVDFAKDNRYLFAPSLTYRPNADTSFTLLANFQRDDSNTTAGFLPWRGTLYPNPAGQIPSSFFVSEPDFDRFTARQASIGYQFEHKPSSVWTVRQNLRYSHSTVDYRSIYTAGFTGATHGWVPGSDRLLRRTLYWDQPTLNSFAVDTQAQADFRTGPLTHTLLTGVDYQHAEITGRNSVDGSAAPIDVFNPVYGNYVLPSSMRDKNASTQRQTGLYMQDQIGWNKWLLMLGLRYDWSRAGQDNTPSAARSDNELTKRAGLMYRSDVGLNPYVSYTESFQGLAGFNRAGQAFEPLRGRQWEAGVKYQPPGKNATLTLAVFDMRERNRKASGVVNSVPDTVQIGKARTRGVEVEALASLTNRLDLIANYTYLDAKVVEGNAAEMGRQITSIPSNMASLWATYKFKLFDTPGFSTGGGVRYVGHSDDGTGNNRVGSVTLVDAMVAYDHGPVRLALNVTNLFDRDYVSTCLSRGDCYFGARRTVVGSMTYRF
ncbi:iron complex outermembrane receptor protein [Cupriavidus gilardii J11]|uniref:Iron complex outermembrane receptor protein n=1 Tax=Cupriavidus gilardii J11 TaxID=936133 RepID=A0A562B4U4_9BURK|nr:TonB-dependent siderophore receptor [Cupriavidus gilardii]TWG80231.1 iron complex outermembrane receptor protein [Cupriavidus gilardii J11]